VPDELSDVVEVEPNSPDFDAVVALARGAKKTLGPMPDEGFTDRAEKGTLLAARLGGEVVGYALFDLPGDKVKLVHLCVRPTSRGSGVARTLVEAVSQRHQQRRGIELACRRDYEVNKMWPRLGFAPLHERPGRSKRRLPLNLWFRDHGHPDLFSDVRPGQEMAVVDHMIVIDSARGFLREGKHSQPLFDAWVGEYVELYVTGETYVEIDRNEDSTVRESTRAAANSLRLLRVSRASWQALLEAVRDAAPDAGASDHHHLAQAAAGGADYFVTRDDDILKAADQLAQSLQIQTLRPEALVRRLDRLRVSDRYEPRVIEATAILNRSATEIPEDHLVRAFLNHGGGEKKSRFLDVLRTLLAGPTAHEASIFTDEDGRLLGLLGRTTGVDRIDVSLLRVGTADPLQDVVARQLVYQQRQKAADYGIPQVMLSDPYPSAAVQLALPLEGFVPQGNGWACGVERGVREATSSELRHGALGAAAVERRRWPVKLVGAEIPVYLVPIKLGWAERLFDTRLAEQTLLPRGSVLGLSREHVYYRSVPNHREIRPGARILWYVSGTGPAQQESHIRATSQVAEVVTGRPRTLHRRFQRLGVYSEKEVIGAAGASGEVMAIRFVDTELLAHPMSLTELRALFAERAQTFTHPISPQLLGERMFCPIYQRTSAYAA
jgi:GNAT superfamily N-acetyltransferase/predicted nucleic acid-binding protein